MHSLWANPIPGISYQIIQNQVGSQMSQVTSRSTCNLAHGVTELRSARALDCLYNIRHQRERFARQSDLSQVELALRQVQDLPFEEWDRILTPAFQGYMSQLDPSLNGQDVLISTLKKSLEVLLEEDESHYVC